MGLQLVGFLVDLSVLVMSAQPEEEMQMTEEAGDLQLDEGGKVEETGESKVEERVAAETKVEEEGVAAEISDLKLKAACICVKDSSEKEVYNLLIFGAAIKSSI